MYSYTADSGFEKNACLEIANQNKGGVPTWEDGSSIRKTVYDTESGRFDRSSTKELPTGDICMMVREGAIDDIFTLEECIAMRDTLISSIQRLS